MRSWQAPSFFSNSPAPSYITGGQNWHGGKPGSDKVVKKINTQLLIGQLSLSLQPRDSACFTPWAFISTLNTEDDSVHNCFLVLHPLSIRHSHLKRRLGETQQPSPVTLSVVTESTQGTVSIHLHPLLETVGLLSPGGIRSCTPWPFWGPPSLFSSFVLFSGANVNALLVVSLGRQDTGGT